MTTRPDGAANQPIELTEDDLQEVTGGAMITAVKPVAVTTNLREDPCAGGQIKVAAR